MWNLACLERKLKELEQNLNCDEKLEQYGIYKNELNDIYNDISNGIKIRSKCDWYKFGEKSNTFLLNLEANCATQSVVHKVISNEQEITDISKIIISFNFIRISLKKSKVLVRIVSTVF